MSLKSRLVLLALTLLLLPIALVGCSTPSTPSALVVPAAAIPPLEGADDFAGRAAAEAGELRAAGLGCERSYDALSASSPTP